MISRSPDRNAFSENDINDTLQAVETNPAINKKANYYDFRKRYQEKGIDLDAEFAKRRKTIRGEHIKNDFFNDVEGSAEANLAEMLPLYANAPGRLGDYLQVSVTKTAKQDDGGNNFIDLIIEVKNTWIAGAPKELQDVPAKMTFLVDVTVSNDAARFRDKVHALEQEHLLPGKKAEVLCYEDDFGKLGTERPKILVKQNGKNLEDLSTKLGECINRLASDKFIINKPEAFDRLYRAYFSDLMSAIAENAAVNSVYLKSLVPDPKRASLAREYDKIVKFVEAYKKTPITKSRTA